MTNLDIKRIVATTLTVVGLIVLLAGCDSAGAGDDDSSGDTSGGNGSNCDETTMYQVEWRFSGSYSDSVSVATTWIKPSGEFSDPSDTKYASINPSDGTLLTETLPGCSGASINITMLEGAGDTDMVNLTGVTLSIYVNGNLADSVDLSGSYPEGDILPSPGGLTVVVGQ